MNIGETDRTNSAGTPRRLAIPPVSSAAPGPLYQQIVDGIKREISEGRLEPGAMLPSFRQLAEELFVSLITVKRAYEDLEREGIIFRKQGLGTFVSEHGADRSREAKVAQARSLIEQAIREASEAGLSEDEILAITHELLEREALIWGQRR
ncbi:MAG: GntR family transcriptional regulator [Candidatus Hydrogenedentes bacterium]|nr:GntR family transcriptional regulator [Candidatus Hydrogenedentota bacterium]